MVKRLDDLQTKRKEVTGEGIPDHKPEASNVIAWKIGDPVVTVDGDTEVGELDLQIPYHPKDEDFEVIEKINRVLDGRREEGDITSWNIDKEIEESRESDEEANRKGKVNKLVDRRHSKQSERRQRKKM